MRCLSVLVSFCLQLEFIANVIVLDAETFELAYRIEINRKYVAISFGMVDIPHDPLGEDALVAHAIIEPAKIFSTLLDGR